MTIYDISRLVRKRKIPEKKARILIADDHQIIRDGLHILIDRQKDMEVIGEAETGREAVELARTLDPDVIIMDVTMPELNGIEATRLLAAEQEDIKVIGFSMHSDQKFILGMMDAGARGYILKDSAFDELADVIRQVRKNHIYLSSGIQGAVAEKLLQNKQQCSCAAPVRNYGPETRKT